MVAKVFHRWGVSCGQDAFARGHDSGVLDFVQPDISVVMPVFNECRSVGRVLGLLSKINWQPYNVEVIVVDDGSTDSSGDIISMFPFVDYVRHEKNLGKGAALKTGFMRASGKVVVIQDADMEYEPNIIPLLVKPILCGEADVVYGSRFSGKIDGMKFSHYFGNTLLSLAARILFVKRITDVMTGSKAFSRAVVDSFRLEQSGFEVEVEMTSQSLRNGWRFDEIPIRYRYRVADRSKIGFVDGIYSLAMMFLLAYKSKANASEADAKLH